MIEYRHNFPLDPKDVVRVFESSGITRPTKDLPRITRMFAESNLVISAWSHGTLVGVCRALTDYSYCCYVSDLAVAKEFQRRGLGRRLVQEVRDAIGDGASLILVSNDNAVFYYPKLGFSRAESAYIIKRRK